MYSIWPIDKDAILAAAAKQKHLFSAEEHNVTGGFGSAVADVLAEAGAGCKLHKIGMPGRIFAAWPPDDLYKHYGIDAEGVAKRVREALQTK